MSSLDDKLATAKAKVPDTYNAGKTCKDLNDFSYFFFRDARIHEMLENIKTNNGTNFRSMFSDCKSLTTIPQLDTSNGLNFASMFGNNSTIKTIPQLDTSNGLNFAAMFTGCKSLTAIPQLDTSNNSDFNYMFSECAKLTTIPQLDTSNGTDFHNMFENCSKLTSIPLLNTANGRNFNNMFKGCTELTNVSFTIIKASISFRDCPKLDAFTLRGIVEALEVKTTVSSSYKLTLNATSWDLLEHVISPPSGYSTWKEYITNYKKWTYA